MPKTRPDGSPLTPDDIEFWNQPYTFTAFPKMLYRRRRSGIARGPANETFLSEGTTKTPAGIVLEYLTVQSAAAAAAAAADGWADHPTTIARLPHHCD